MLLRAGSGQSHILQDWMLHEFAPAQHASHQIIVNLAVDEPEGLNLYGSSENLAGERCDLVLEAVVDDEHTWPVFLQALQRQAPMELSMLHAYAVSVTTVIHREGFVPSRPTPGYKLLRGLYLFDDLPDVAAQRMWAHHSELAKRVHLGLARYARHWVTARLTPESPQVRGFSDLHFPDEESLRLRYFDSDRGRQEILHDIGHFIAGGLPRVFTREYVF
jgi:hypothetical protein